MMTLYLSKKRKFGKVEATSMGGEIEAMFVRYSKGISDVDEKLKGVNLPGKVKSLTKALELFKVLMESTPYKSDFCHWRIDGYGVLSTELLIAGVVERLTSTLDDLEEIVKERQANYFNVASLGWEITYLFDHFARTLYSSPVSSPVAEKLLDLLELLTTEMYTSVPRH